MNHILKRKFHKKGYINNFFTVGSPTFEGSVVSGFSDSNYLRINEAFAPNTTDTWEKVVKYTTTSDVTSDQSIIGDSIDKQGMVLVITTSKLVTYISSGTSWDIASQVWGTYTLLPNTTYWFKVEFTGTAYNIYYSLNGIDYVLDITVASTKQISSSIIRLGRTAASNQYVRGSIDLSESYIKIKNELWWYPYKRCKYDFNFTTVGTPSISNPPTCIVSGFSTSNYLVLDNSYKSTDNAEYVFKFRTSSSYTAHQVIIHAEYFLTIELETNGNVWAYNWETASKNVFFNASTNTDYWVKVTINGTTKTCSYSTDGVNFTGEITFTDSKTQPNNTNYQFRFGLSSYSVTSPFLGSIDLTQSYIKINNQLWWSCFKTTEDVVYKEDGTLEDYDFFDYKSYGLETTDYRKGYINNFFVVGAPSIANGSLVSGFSTSNYLRLPQTPDFSTLDSWEWAFKITTGTGTSDQQLIGGLSIERTGVEIGIISSKLKLWLGSTSGSGHDISTNNAVIGTYEIATSTDYWIKLSFTGTKYILSVSENGVSYTDDITVESTLRIRSENLSIGVDKYGGNRPFLGSIDLSECYIKLNGEYLWNPYKRCKYDYNFTTVGTPNISNAPTCEVSGFSSANYLSLPSAFRPADKPWEICIKFTTGSNVSTAQGVFGGKSGTYIMDAVHITGGNFWLAVSSNGSSYNISNKAGTYTVLPNTTYWGKTKFDGSKYTFEYSTDGETFTEDIVAESSLVIEDTTDIPMIGLRVSSPFLGSIDLTQSYIKINNQLWWSCFKQSDHLSFDEKGSDEDYDFINTKRHFLRHPSKRYYKIVPWEQPILTSDTSYGTLTGSSYSGSRYYYCISDGKIPTTNDASDNWGTNNTAIGWVNWALEEEIIIKGIKIYNRSHTSAVDYELKGARFYTDSSKTTPIGEEFEILTSQGIYELKSVPEKGIKTNQIYFYKTGNTYSGLGELEITADKKVQSTYKDWDFYETIREVRKFYKNVSDYTYTATNGWSNVSNVFDGSADTYATCGTATDYIEIDFGKEVYIDSFVATGNWVDSVARAEDLRLYTVGDSDIETLVAQSSGSAATTTYTTSASFNRVKTSKIRFKLSETNYAGNPPTTQYPTRIREINIKPYCESDSSDYDFYKLEEEKNTVYNNKTLKINPTPSNAIVTINGEERNEIELMRNSSVSWSVSLDGYKTQSGSLTLTEDTVLDITLEERGDEPLWACYKQSAEQFVYVKIPLTEASSFGWVVDYKQVSSSSELENLITADGIVGVDDEILVYDDDGYHAHCTRYYEGDLYE